MPHGYVKLQALFPQKTPGGESQGRRIQYYATLKSVAQVVHRHIYKN